MPKILGVDYGRKNVGLSISDEDEKYAFEFKTVNSDNDREAVELIKESLEGERIYKIIVGLPLDQYGGEGEAANHVREFGNLLAGHFDLPVDYIDERFSTMLVKQQAHEAGKNIKSIKKTKDQKSAQLILQTYLFPL